VTDTERGGSSSAVRAGWSDQGIAAMSVDGAGRPAATQPPPASSRSEPAPISPYFTPARTPITPLAGAHPAPDRTGNTPKPIALHARPSRPKTHRRGSMFARFVDRPILAGVISVLITLIGAVAGLTLPIAQFPEIAPPIINIQATYPGASAQQAYDAVTTPLEQEINGAQHLLYIASTSNSDGSVNLDATFEIGSDLDAAAAEVLTRANRAEAKLPASVRSQGLEIQKSSRQRLGNIVLYADPDAPYDELFLANWAETQVIKPLRRVDGMGRIQSRRSATPCGCGSIR
jgi:hypothetical protein